MRRCAPLRDIGETGAGGGRRPGRDTGRESLPSGVPALMPGPPPTCMTRRRVVGVSSRWCSDGAIHDEDAVVGPQGGTADRAVPACCAAGFGSPPSRTAASMTLGTGRRSRSLIGRRVQDWHLPEIINCKIAHAPRYRCASLPYRDRCAKSQRLLRDTAGTLHSCHPLAHEMPAALIGGGLACSQTHRCGACPLPWSWSMRTASSWPQRKPHSAQRALGWLLFPVPWPPWRRWKWRPSETS